MVIKYDKSHQDYQHRWQMELILQKLLKSTADIIIFRKYCITDHLLKLFNLNLNQLSGFYLAYVPILKQ
jgi:hypothetical protein